MLDSQKERKSLSTVLISVILNYLIFTESTKYLDCRILLNLLTTFAGYF